MRLTGFWDDEVKHNLSLGVVVSIRKRYAGGPRFDGCPIRVVYLDGNNSKFGGYPRFARVWALSERPLRYECCGSGTLCDPYCELAPELRICARGRFPRYLDINVSQQPWTLLLQEDSMETEPSLKERWQHHCQTAGVVVPFLDYIALDGIFGYVSPSQLSTTATVDSELLHLINSLLPGAQATPPRPPKSRPEPDIFKIGQQPRRIQGGP